MGINQTLGTIASLITIGAGVAAALIYFRQDKDNRDHLVITAVVFALVAVLIVAFLFSRPAAPNKFGSTPPVATLTTSPPTITVDPGTHMPTSGPAYTPTPCIILDCQSTPSPTPIRSPTPTLPLLTPTPLQRSIKEYSIAGGTRPERIVHGPDGNLWFNEYLAKKIGRITTNGSFSDFPINDANNALIGITVGPDGNIWYVGQNLVGWISPVDFSFMNYSLQATGIGIGIAYSIVVGPDKNLWFTCNFGNTGQDGHIGKVTTSGAITYYSTYSQFDFPSTIVSGADGNLWFTAQGGNEIERITTSGNVTPFVLPRAGVGPDGLTVGPDNALWFTEIADGGNAIGRMTYNGVVTNEWHLPSSQSQPAWITGGTNNDLWFTEYQNNRIGRITLSGDLQELPPLPTEGSAPSGIVLGPDGKMWFTEDQGSKVGTFNP